MPLSWHVERGAMAEDKFYTVAEVAELLKVQPLTIYRLISDGKLKSYKVGRVIRISEADLKAFLDDSRQGKDEA